MELRAETERRMQKRMYSEYFGVSLGSFVLALPALALGGEFLYLGAGLGIGWLATKAYARFRPRSALALYAERRRRLEIKPSPGGPLALPTPASGAAAEDPEELDLLDTLRWLGVSSDDPKRR